ncbi:NAD(P)-dependent oxidoreductase [Marinobacter sp. M3C]|jgi:3-hydroxyisobutyrate dehydrogenase|uniref:NAD(P)-dependent oxidoreductase n=1 Tax=Marinobacter sp. M3C TaxID=2917715 RepID=UPI00200BAD44|nr:NAD(P)-dependent oxidoreductase [Marinobacter sp. M3C]MCL1488617.1 NAD(P)-dependent oxidoreductase [Marinobacter sp.]UQG60100.1 NAD(P)-dependent oxidoreductase [Marinobacter sp. M3C]
MSSQKVALYGLGNMGYLIAERISSQFSLQVSDLNTAQVERACNELSAEVITCPEQLAGTNYVVLCLPHPSASLSVLKGILPYLDANAVVIETSTVNPADVRRSEQLLAERGIALIDASILAGVSQMAAGTASLLLGGSADVIARAKPVLDSITEKQIVFGPLGTGAAAKVINNAVAHAAMVVVAEAGSMATACGVDIQKLIGLLSDEQMGMHRPLTYRYAKRIANHDYEGGMPLSAALKDSALALELAHSERVPLFAIQASHTVYELGATAGYDREDYAAIAKLWADWGKPTVPAT